MTIIWQKFQNLFINIDFIFLFNLISVIITCLYALSTILPYFSDDFLFSIFKDFKVKVWTHIVNYEHPVK